MSMAAQTSGTAAAPRPMTREEKRVILASSLGTVFEWYDFYLYGSLAVMIGAHFFSAFDPNTRAIFALLAFAAGFLVRPFGAIFFGRLGDLVGRKYTFLITIVIMGASTFLVGLLPSYATHRLGGSGHPDRAAHAPGPGARRRIWRCGGLCRRARASRPSRLLHLLDPDHGDARPAALAARHPRHPRQYGRGRLRRLGLAHPVPGLDLPARHLGLDSPADAGIAGLQEDEGRGHRLEGAAHARPSASGRTPGSPSSRCSASPPARPWSGTPGQFYALFFIQSILKVDLYTANVLIAWSLILGTGGFIVFGSLSDKVGRKPIILAGCLIAALTYFPLFSALTKAANPGLAAAHENVKVQVVADPATCGSVFDPVGVRTFTAPCDVARRTLATQAIVYTQAPAPAGTPAKVTVNGKELAIDATFAANHRQGSGRRRLPGRRRRPHRQGRLPQCAVHRRSR